MKRKLSTCKEHETNEAHKVFYRKIALKTILCESEEIKRLKTFIEYVRKGHTISTCNLCDLYGITNLFPEKYAANIECHAHKKTPQSHLLGCTESCVSDYGLCCTMCKKFSCAETIAKCVDCETQCCKSCYCVFIDGLVSVCNNCYNNCSFCDKYLVRKKKNALKQTNVLMCGICYSKYVEGK